MKYNYQSCLTSIGRGETFWTPEVETIISAKGGSRRVLALVDSGAFVCVADIELAERIGVILDKTNPLHIAGAVAGRSELAYPAHVRLEVEGLKELRTTVYFGKLSSAFTLVLGQEGFFDQFRIIFKKYNNTFEINVPRT